MKLWQRAALLGLAATAAAGAIHLSGYALRLALTAAFVVLFLVSFAPRTSARLIDEIVLRVRAALWRGEEGRHHAHGGLTLAVQDDGRHVWVAAADVRNVLRSSDSDDVLAARHTGRWRRDAKGALWLRADALAAHLASAPGRMEPRTIRLRRYVEEQVLFPAAERRRRARPDGPGRA
jgi:hypothetical protein